MANKIGSNNTQAALQISELKYRRLFEAAQDGILILNAETGQIVDVNPFLVELIGYSYDQFINKAIWDIGFFKDIIANKDAYDELKAKKYIRYEDLPLETADGRKIDVEFVSNVYKENGHYVIQCNVRNITERKRTEKELARHAAEMTAANHSLETFSQSVAHDLRNPLHSILSLIEILKKSIPSDDKEAHEVMSHIVNSGKQMTEIITDLLSLSKIALHETQITKCAMSDIALSVANELRILDKKRNVEIVIEPELFADADEGLVNILLHNLISNAWKFTSNKADARIEFGKQIKDNLTCFFIRDNGAGFDMARVDRLFKPFQRLHSQTEYAGTGIGLTIVKRIIEKHGGTIKVEAEKDKGATFYFSLTMPNKSLPTI